MSGGSTSGLVVREQHEVLIAGWIDREGRPLQMLVVLTEDGRRWVPFTFLVRQGLDLKDLQLQRQRVYEHPTLKKRMAQFRIQTKGGWQLAHMMEWRAVGFYFGIINLTYARPEIRDHLLDFQELAMDALDRLLRGEVPSILAVPTAPELMGRIESIERFTAGLAARVGRLESAQPFTLDEE